MFTLHYYRLALEFFHMSKFYLDEKLHCSSYFNCRPLNNNGLMPKYPLCWSGRQGVREKYFTAKGVRSPKSLGTAALQEFEMRILSKVVTFFRDLCILNKN